MSLKGYQWLDDNGKVLMSYTFKDLTLDVWKDTTKEELDKFIEYIKGQVNFEVRHIDYHDHNVR